MPNTRFSAKLKPNFGDCVVIHVDVQIGENSAFLYSHDMELLFAAQGILLGQAVHNLCSEIYGQEMLEALKKKYHFLFEVFSTFHPYHANGILEHLLTYPLTGFTLTEYREHLLNMKRASFLREHLALDDVREEVIEEALVDDEALEAFYFQQPNLFNNFLGFQTFFRQTARYIEDYVAFAEELRTQSFTQALLTVEQDVERALENTRAGLRAMSPLEWSQELMGKTFHNRGPYACFTFVPSLLVPYRAIRFFGRDQILFFSIRPQSLQDEDILRQLKVIADSTRFNIIALLGEKGPLRGMDIAQAMSVAPSTISHHMEQLKKAGLLHEEQVKNSKYFSINRNNVKELLKRLTETLGK